MQILLDVCLQINLPISQEKTVWGCLQLTFLGLLVDGWNCLVMVPVEKIVKANAMLAELLASGKNKTTVRRLQQLCGFLNFLCPAVPPGHVFTSRLYCKLSS